jgi:hypothetical protein
MPNLTFPVGADRPPVIDLVVAVPEDQADLMRAAGRPVPLPIIVPALLDPGATNSLVSKDIADQLGLEVLGARDIFGVGGTVSVSGNVRIARILFPGIPSVQLANSTFIVAVPNLDHLGARMIVGRDLLGQCILIYNGPHSTCTFAF